MILHSSGECTTRGIGFCARGRPRGVTISRVCVGLSFGGAFRPGCVQTRVGRRDSSCHLARERGDAVTHPNGDDPREREWRERGIKVATRDFR